MQHRIYTIVIVMLLTETVTPVYEYGSQEIHGVAQDSLDHKPSYSVFTQKAKTAWEPGISEVFFVVTLYGPATPNLTSTVGIPGELGIRVSNSGTLHPQPNHKCGFTAKHNLSIFSFCVEGTIKYRQHQMFTSYGFFLFPTQCYKVTFSWLVHTFENADLWIHMKKTV